MEWSEGDKWSLEVDLSPGVTDFKCAVVRQNGSVVCWEPGANRTVEVHSSGCCLLKLTWQYHIQHLWLTQPGKLGLNLGSPQACFSIQKPSGIVLSSPST